MKKVLLFSLPVLLAGAAWFWFYGRPAYARYKEHRALGQAERFLARGDYRNASLSARQALAANRSSVEACRLMAGLAERVRSPAVLDWRRRLAELAPTLENQLRYAAAALRLQGPPYPLATRLLEQLPASATNSADYQALAAELALKQNRLSQAIAHFEQAARLEPAQASHRLNLAVLELGSTNAAVAAAARATLQGFSTNSSLGRVALRWLVADRMKHEDLAAAERFCDELLADPACGLEDRLEHLAILQQRGATNLAECLRRVQRQALTNPGSIYAVSDWMVARGLATNAVAWLAACPASLQKQQPVPLAFAEALLAARNWQQLDALLRGQKWGDLEYLRLAFLSQAAAGERQGMEADVCWRAALREAGERLGALTSLLGLAGRWQRDQAREDVLWQIARRFPGERWALLDLEGLYNRAGDTRGLNKLYALMASYDPANFVARNNLAATYLLLKMNLPRGHELAREVYAQHPQEAIVASTYAYSLQLQGRTREGLAVLEKLPPEALANPSVALYYGCLLSALGQTNQADHYLQLAGTGHLLPEERALELGYSK